MVPLNKRVAQRTFIRIKAVFSLDMAAWLHLLWNFSLVIFFLSLVLLQGIGRKYTWTAWECYQDMDFWLLECKAGYFPLLQKDSETNAAEEGSPRASILKGRAGEPEAKRACSFAFMSAGFPTLILNKGNSYYGCYGLRIPVSQERRSKPQLSIQFTHLSVKLKTIVVKDNPWDVGLDTNQCFWFLDRWLVLGTIGHSVVIQTLNILTQIHTN